MTDLLEWGEQKTELSNPKNPPGDEELSWLCQLVELRPDESGSWSVNLRGYDARFSLAGIRGLLFDVSLPTIPTIVVMAVRGITTAMHCQDASFFPQAVKT